MKILKLAANLKKHGDSTMIDVGRHLRRDRLPVWLDQPGWPGIRAKRQPVHDLSWRAEIPEICMLRVSLTRCTASSVGRCCRPGFVRRDHVCQGLGDDTVTLYRKMYIDRVVEQFLFLE